jgi:hypothetical protein
MLNTGEQHSWASLQMASIRKTQDELTQVQQNLLSHQAANTREHKQLARDTRNTVASIAVDQRFIEHVREIVRFLNRRERATEVHPRHGLRQAYVLSSDCCAIRDILHRRGHIGAAKQHPT